MTGPTPALQFRVAGLPITQGSKTAFMTRHKDPAARRAIMRDQNHDRVKPWREAVRSDAVAAFPAGWVPLDGPIRVVLLFALPRPAKPKYPWPIGANSGDVDKLTRAVFDALTDAGVWADDSRVVDERVIKDYPGERVAQNSPGVLIRIWRADDAAPPPSTGQIPLLLNETGGTP